MKVLGLALYGPLAASTRYRLTQYAPGLAAMGIALDVQALLGDEYVRRSYAGEPYPWHRLVRDYADRAVMLASKQHRYDAAIINAEVFPLLPGFLERHALHTPYVYDFDDAFFLKYRLERFRRFSFLLKNKLDPVVEGAAAVTAGNSYLLTYAKQHNDRAVHLPTVVDTDRYAVVPCRDASVFTVGWIGSGSTAVYLSEIASALEVLGKEGNVRFVVVGGRMDPIPGVEVRQIQWSEDTEIDLINSFDIGVMPLFDDEWAQGKCAFKLIQYMACGVPVIGSRVGANVDVVTPECGFLASTSTEWLVALRALRDDSLLRARMGQAGRQRVEDRYSLRYALPILSNALHQAAASGRR